MRNAALIKIIKLENIKLDKAIREGLYRISFVTVLGKTASDITPIQNPSLMCFLLDTTLDLLHFHLWLKVSEEWRN